MKRKVLAGMLALSVCLSAGSVAHPARADAENTHELTQSQAEKSVIEVQTPSYAVDGKSTEYLSKGMFSASVPLRNNSDTEQKSVCVVLALYSGNVLKGISLSEETLEAGESKTASVSMKLDSDEYTAKLMVWNSVEHMTPYCTAYQITAAPEQTPTPTPTPSPTPTEKPLSKPAELTAAENSYKGIKLKWQASEDDISGYRVYRKTAEDEQYTELAELNSDTVEYTDTFVQFNSSYEYAVQSFNDDKQSELASLKVDSIEGASVLLNKFEGKNITLSGHYMKAFLTENPSTPTGSESEFIAAKSDANGVSFDCVRYTNGTGAGRYLQISVNDEYMESGKDNRAAVVVTYFDEGTDKIKMQYNAADGNNYKGADIVKKTNTKLWKTAVYVLEDADFRQIGDSGYDFRLNFDNPSTNYFAMVQLVNLADKFGVVAESTDKISLNWRRVVGSERCKLYRNGQLLGSFDSTERAYLDTGLTEGTEYEYRLTALFDGEEREVSVIKASTQKYIVAEIDFDNDIARGIEISDNAGISDDLVSGIRSKIASETESGSFNFKIDKNVVSGSKNRLVTIKYNDCGYNGYVRVSMVNPVIDRAHYFRTNGSNRWETVTVLIPDAAFNNNDSDLQIRTGTDKKKFAISSVQLSNLDSMSMGGIEMSGISSGITIFDNYLNSTLSCLWLTNQSTASTDIDGSIILDTTNVGTNSLKDPTVRVVPDYRYLGQTYGNAVLPGESGYDEKPAAVRPIDVRITYQKANKNGSLKIKGSKLKDNSVVHDTVDAEFSLVGDGEWVTEQVTLRDFFVQGKSIDERSYVEFTFTGVPADEKVHIKEIEICNNDISFTAEYKKELGAVVIDWSETGGDSYEIYKDGKLLTTVSSLPYRDTEIKDGEEYVYSIAAYKDGELIKSGAGLKYVKIDGIASVDENMIKIGQYVKMGSYNGEDILWRCVGYEKISGETEDGIQIMDATTTATECRAGYLPIMVSEQILCMKAFDAAGDATEGSHGRGADDSRKNYGSNYWGDSNLRDWLNSDKAAGEILWSCGNAPSSTNGGFKAAYEDEAGFLTNFSDWERKAMYTVNQKLLLCGNEYSDEENSVEVIKTKFDIENAAANYKTAYSEQVSDTMFLLDVQQLVNINSNSAVLGDDWYMAYCTDKCKSVHNSPIFGKQYSDSYWLRTPASFAESSSNVRIVTASDIKTHTIPYSLAYSGTRGVRPAFFINQSDVELVGNGTKDSPFTVSAK